MTTLDPNQLLYKAFEPKLKNRFFISMDGIPSYLVKNFNGLGFEQGEVMINHINSYFKVKGGRLVWNDLTLGLYDPISPSGAALVMEWARMHHETVTGRAGYADMYQKNFNLIILGPVGDIVGEWLVKGAFIKNADFGDWSWDDPDVPQEISLTLGINAAVNLF